MRTLTTFLGSLAIAISMLFLLNLKGYSQEREQQWHPFEESVAIAWKMQKPIFVDVWAPWCGWCHKMKKEVYPKLKEELNNYVLARLNRDDNKSSIIYRSRSFSPLKLAKEFNIDTVPAIVILSPKGTYLLHITGFTEGESLKPILDYISEEAYKNQTFSEYSKKIKK